MGLGKLVRRMTGAEARKVEKLHIGSGPHILEGWFNIDNQPYKGVDLVHDVIEGLPFDDVSFIYAEHFIEHIPYHDAVDFLRTCHSILREDGVLRLSTPNLDWVWRHNYHPNEWSEDHEAVRDCFWMNRAFRGWVHQFLYNLPTLTATLHDAGFAKVVPCRYGESDHPELQDVEGHEQYPDDPDLPHVVVVEASGAPGQDSEILTGPLAEYDEAVKVR